MSGCHITEIFGSTIPEKDWKKIIPGFILLWKYLKVICNERPRRRPAGTFLNFL